MRSSPFLSFGGKYWSNSPNYWKFAKYNTLINENDRNLVCAIEFINHTKEEEDKTAKPNNTQVVVEHKRSAKVLWTARIALCLFALTALALLVWGVREVYWLVA